MRQFLICTITVLLLISCASTDPQLAEQLKLFELEARYFVEQENPLCTPYVESYPAKSIIPDGQPPFTLDPTTAWTIIFGRGGGPIGYKMIKMDEQGTVRLLYYDATYREGVRYFVGKKGVLTLSVEDIRTFIEYINAFALMGMPKAYHAALYDGTHWELRIQQGAHRKSLHFHNHFPQDIIEFANTIDRLLITSGLFEVSWETIPMNEAHHYEEMLWE